MKLTYACILAILALSFPRVTFAADVDAPETSVSVGTDSTVVSARATRRLFLLQNVSDTTVWCKSGGRTAVVGEGWALNPYQLAGQAGGSLLFDVVVPTGQISCIHGGTGTKTVNKTEG